MDLFLNLVKRTFVNYLCHMSMPQGLLISIIQMILSQKKVNQSNDIQENIWKFIKCFIS